MNNFNINEEKINKLANLAVKRGVRLQKGQNLLITAPIESLPLVRKITEFAYKEGAHIVTPFFTDSDITLSRFKYAPNESFDTSTDWLFNGMGEAFDNNTCRMAITGDDPTLLSNINADKVSRANKAMAKAYKPARERITEFKINWNIVSWPTKGWAKKVFPDLPIEEAVFKLSEALFDASRVSVDDPIQEWDDHNEKLRLKTKWLNQQNFSELQYKGPNTNLRIGLALNHAWMGGASKAQNGITCNPNIPSEEVFTTPHAFKVEGTVCSTKPLSYQGTLIEDIKVTFKEGKIIEAHANKGEKVFKKLLQSDENSSRLGEVALVPHSSPISQSGIIYFNTLLDENSSSHIAQGQCYSKCFKENFSNKEIKNRGGNQSQIHVDWMIGNNQIDVDGIDQNENAIPIFRKGEWVN